MGYGRGAAEGELGRERGKYRECRYSWGDGGGFRLRQISRKNEGKKNQKRRPDIRNSCKANKERLGK